MADGSRKRKQPSGNAGPSNPVKRTRFQQRPQHTIPAIPTSNAYPNGEINVNNFLKAHENEIKSLQGAMQAAKKGLSRRAFQDVPRQLRRRTASHNPHRVPKRLRVRARQEAKEDNTPISRGTSGSGVGKGKKKFLRKEGRKNSRQTSQQRVERAAAAKKDHDGDAAMEDAPKQVTKPPPPRLKRRFPALATPATPPSRFRRRQRDKTWLPTHLWHAKRAKMTDPKQPLWRFAIPLQPVTKAYRLTHRAATQRGAVAWDMSYMSTLSLEGPEASITGLLKGLHFAADGAEDPWQNRGRAKKWKNGTRAWEGWIYDREAKPLRKIAQVTVIWCAPQARGSRTKAFVRVHPSAFLQLWNQVVRIAKVQKPAVTVRDVRFDIGSIEITGPAAAEALCSILAPVSSPDAGPNAPESLWPTLASVTNPATLPNGALLSFDISDPRLRDPPHTSPIAHDQQSLTALTETLAIWPFDNTPVPASIFDTNSRLAAQRTMASQKSINRRKSAYTLGEDAEARPTDPRIPTLVFVSRESKSWTVLLPWKCVMPVWRGIMRYPVSTSGNPLSGGLKEKRQVDFERSKPHFPYDHPGTDAGWSWELREREVRKHEWTKRPKGRRIEWSTIDLGNRSKGEIGDPWSCDWERLVPRSKGEITTPLEESEEARTPVRQLSFSDAVDLVEKGSATLGDSSPSPDVFTVKITMVQRGAPTDCARIYRLPTDPELGSKWLSLMPRPDAERTRTKQKGRGSGEKRGRSLLDNGPPKAGEEDYPLVPDEADLIGFVTTGNYNLAEGMPTAVANVAAHKVAGVPSADRVCIVRQAGSTIGRLARWEVI
ncbi:ribonuclease P/MRP protein subunit POP1 [Alternaria panax]|uniref:Ribonuclease P/MRP protein subunit POP1 n=1 Tax=Alternaria panax TaxID=48097 RepID=A0AAD4I1M9_9PLEO|nr:ribonuclease P/MRP protein subunit POP1 [Alternaria panax]